MLLEAARGHQVWVEARLKSDYEHFKPALAKNLELKKRYVECFEWDDHPYTTLLDDYEPFMTTSEVVEVFDRVEPVLSELVQAAPKVDAPFLDLPYPADRQRAFAERVVRTLGFADDAWRLDPTVHPFCISFSNRDVRLTTRYNATGLDSFWSTMHESGHGLYAHGIADSLLRTPLASSPSPGLNEAQGRTWENLVGRSAAFWGHWDEPLQETSPGNVSSSAPGWAALRRPKPSRPISRWLRSSTATCCRTSRGLASERPSRR